jgi:hypothetical protein
MTRRHHFAAWFRSGGYLVPLVLVVALVVLGWGLSWILPGLGSRAVGDRETLESYRFPLEPLLVPRPLIATPLVRDGVRVLDQPPVISNERAMEDDVAGRGKYLVPSDRVIGVGIGGEARAYPIRVLNWHEIVNDTVGGRPLLITYNPLCDSSAVFEREIDGEVLEFGFSGLLARSNLLLYDRRPRESRQSLWSQLEARAIAGPAAARGQQLELVPFVVEHWGRWRERHPETTVLEPDLSMAKLYRRNPYGPYYGDERLRFPVEPLPPSGGPALKTPLVAVQADGRWWAMPIEALAAHGPRPLELGDRRLVVEARTDPPAASVAAVDGGPPPPRMYALWFAWYAHHPETVLLAGPAALAAVGAER